jgi:hypothetical protein
MPGGARLPSGEPRKACQKRSRKAAVPIAVIATPTFNPGDRVRWSRYVGTVRRVAGDKADIVENVRKTVWRVPLTDLTRVAG